MSIIFVHVTQVVHYLANSRPSIILLLLKMRWSLYCKWRTKEKMSFLGGFLGGFVVVVVALLPFFLLWILSKRTKDEKQMNCHRTRFQNDTQMETYFLICLVSSFLLTNGVSILWRILYIHWIIYYRHEGHLDTPTHLASLHIIIWIIRVKSGLWKHGFLKKSLAGPFLSDHSCFSAAQLR